MNNKSLHIISFDVPFPADYGGAIDVFYRVKALHQLGVKITLHCFEYGRGQQKELEKYCETIFYYKRHKSPQKWLSKIPFIVKSRESSELLDHLLKNDFPILFEGIHTTSFLAHPKLKNRIKLVRMHNIENDYYNLLAKNATGLKKIYFQTEAKKLAKYESVLSQATAILAIKESDKDYFRSINKNTFLLPVSCPPLSESEQITTKPFALFHGNLSVLENEIGALWLMKNVFTSDFISSFNQPFSFVISGKNPSKKTIDFCQKTNTTLISNPSDKEMKKLIETARIHVFYTDQATGVKLKLINALNTSGHVLVNDKMIEGTGIQNGISIAIKPREYQQVIERSAFTELSKLDYEKRTLFNQQYLNTAENCKLILTFTS